jgi:Uncharacterized conserved protein
MKEISINTDFIKLDQFLKWTGVAESGAFAKDMILNGSVRVNGQVSTQRGKKLYKGDTVVIDDNDEFTIV